MEENAMDVIPQYPSVCPLCQSTVRLFLINLHEKFRMCENTTCLYPFGYEELQFVEYTEDSLYEGVFTTNGSRKAMGSPIPSTASFEINEMTGICETEGSESISLRQIGTQKTENQSDLRQDEKEIMKHVAEIKELQNKILCLEDGENIQNKNRIKNLKNNQEIPGLQMLKLDELSLLKERPTSDVGEFKINIDNMSGIKIEIFKKEQPGDNLNVTNDHAIGN